MRKNSFIVIRLSLFFLQGCEVIPQQKQVVAKRPVKSTFTRFTPERADNFAWKMTLLLFALMVPP